MIFYNIDVNNLKISYFTQNNPTDLEYAEYVYN